MNKEERRSFVNNIEYIPYIQLDNEQKQMISDFVKDYDTLQSQLDIANKKLDKIKEYVDIELTFCNTTTLNEILKDILSIIDGSDE